MREYDFYDAKGAVEAALDAIGVNNAEFAAADVRHLRKGQSAAISLSGSRIGYLGRLNEEIAASYKFKQPVYVAEIDLQSVLEVAILPITYSPLAKYPGTTRDISLLVKRDTTFAQIRAAVAEQNFELCKSIGFVDIYEGKGLADDERSITVRLEYRSDERTLIDDEVEAAHKQIVAGIDQKLNVKQRF